MLEVLHLEFYTKKARDSSFRTEYLSDAQQGEEDTFNKHLKYVTKLKRNRSISFEQKLYKSIAYATTNEFKARGWHLRFFKCS